MSFEKVQISIVGDSPGRTTELNYFRIGPKAAKKKVYLQAALHADEQPGILILHHLLNLLRLADDAGELSAEFVLFPMVNPLGMGDIEFNQHQGRYNRSSGVNHNRGWPDLYSFIENKIEGRLGDDADENKKQVRQALKNWLGECQPVSAHEQWQQAIITEAYDADYVFDVHCDDDALMHIYTLPQMEETMQQLANSIGSAATLLAEDSGGGSFDEVWPAVWLKFAESHPDKAIPLPINSCTLEYRGQFDTFDALNQSDAENLYGFFQREGLIQGQEIGQLVEAAIATDLRATEVVRTNQAGLLAYCVGLGARVEKDEKIADLIQLDGEGAFVERTPIYAGTSGLILSRATNKYVWRNAIVAKIVGQEILATRSGDLLGD